MTAFDRFGYIYIETKLLFNAIRLTEKNEHSLAFIHTNARKN